MLSKKGVLIILSFILISILSSNLNNTYAIEGGKDQTALTKKIDTKDLSGVIYWIVNIYNENRLMYAIIVTLVMAILGTTLAFGTDFILKIFGMDVSRISHRE